MTRHDALCLVAELRCEAAMWQRRGEHALAEARRATARRILHTAPPAADHRGAVLATGVALIRA